jgi:pyruvate/2-oxoacid:ferredoxin oxidoreductase alpha subunit
MNNGGTTKGTTVSAAQQIAAFEEAKLRARRILGNKLRDAAMELARYGLDADVIAVAMGQAASEASKDAERFIDEEDARMEAYQ